ncbi:MAG: hypothetical protein ABSH06_28910 [Thermodesulfobacteriota bacterium]
MRKVTPGWKPQTFQHALVKQRMKRRYSNGQACSGSRTGLRCGFAVQQLLEILDALVIKIIGTRDKKLILGIVSLIVGLVLAFGAGLRVLQPLGVIKADFLDGVVTALIVSAGTEGFNSIMKFLGYAKEDKKSGAAESKKKAGPEALSLVERR